MWEPPSREEEFPEEFRKEIVAELWSLYWFRCARHWVNSVCFVEFSELELL